MTQEKMNEVFLNNGVCIAETCFFMDSSIYRNTDYFLEKHLPIIVKETGRKLVVLDATVFELRKHVDHATNAERKIKAMMGLQRIERAIAQGTIRLVKSKNPCFFDSAILSEVVEKQDYDYYLFTNDIPLSRDLVKKMKNITIGTPKKRGSYRVYIADENGFPIEKCIS